MNKKLLLSLALTATLIPSAIAVETLSEHARTLPANQEMQSVKTMKQLSATPLLKSASITSEKVVATKNLKNGQKINFVKGADGIVRKQLVVADNAQQIRLNNSTRFKEVKATTKAASFFENFQSYDGEAYDWLPTNWQDVSKVGSVAPGAGLGKLNLTWCTSDDPFGPASSNPDYYARCQVSVPLEEGEIIKAQDEWLITPSVTVKPNENLYFYLGYKPSWTLLDAETMTFTAENNIVEVQISEDGGTTWTKKWDCLAHAKSYTEDELWDDVMSMNPTWIYVPVHLSEYEGKNIKIAFRYVGMNGESAYIDDVTISVANPVAKYRIPEGAFYWGLSDDYIALLDLRVALGAAYAESTWINRSSLDSESFTWDYSDPFTGEPEVSNEENLTIFAPYSQTDGMTLTASAPAAADSKYTGIDIIQTGGEAATETSYYGAGTYDISLGGLTMSTEFGSDVDAIWTQILGLSGDDKAEVTGFANLFEKPAHSYALSKVTVKAVIDADPSAEYTLSMSKVDDNGVIGEPFAIGKATANDIVTTNTGLANMTFTFKIVDPVTGLEEDGLFTIDSAIYLSLSGIKSAAVKGFNPLWLTGTSNPAECYSYVELDQTKGGKVTKGRIPTDALVYTDKETNEEMYCTSFIFNLDATFTWFETEEDTFVAPLAGGSKTFDVNAYYYSAGWTVEEEVDGTLPEWITYTAEEVGEVSKLTFNVEPLPSGVEGRSFDVTVSIPGTTKVFKISQGSSGVNDAVVNSIKVTNVGGDFAVSYPATVSAVKIYNVSGQLVKDVALTEAGSSVIPAQELAKGVYIMQFNDNQSVKVIK